MNAINYKTYQSVTAATGVSGKEVPHLIEAYLKALGIDASANHRVPERTALYAALLDRKYQGAIIKWWYIDRKAGAPPPFGYGVTPEA